MSSEISDPLKPLSEVCKPDDRQQFLNQSLQSIHAELSELTLHERVPAGVRQLFETAKNARLYTYFVYPFHQLAEMAAYQTLERALKVSWNSEVARLPSIDDESFKAPGLRELLDIAVQRGWLRKNGFTSRLHRAYSAFSDLQAVAAIQAMQKDGTEERVLPAPSQEELNAIIESVDVPRLLADHLPDLRNQLAHGSQRLSPTSDLVLLDIRDAVAMIFDGTPAIDAPEAETTKHPGLHQSFKIHLTHLETKRRALMAMAPVTRDSLPRAMPKQGVYVLSEAGRHLYVGRSDGLRGRIAGHCRVSSKHNMASFAFRLAKEISGIGPATYTKDSRAAI